VFLIKRIFEAFIFPPGLFAVLPILAALVMFRWKDRRAAWLSLSVGIFIWICSMPILADRLLMKLEDDLKIPAVAGGDVIILLGSGFSEGAMDMTGPGVPSPEMMSRIVTAVRLQKRTGLPLIISSGVSFTGKVTEADAAARIIEDLGVGREKIFKEAESKDTGDNAVKVRRICDANGFKKAILVTSASHMKRALMIFRMAGFDVVPFPAAFSTWEKNEIRWREFLPTSTSLDTSLHEFIGLVYYRIFFKG